MIIGIVGKPNCGKSTFFKAATLADVEIANYPFATIKPNHGVGFVRVDCVDSFFKTRCSPKFGACVSHNRFVPFKLIDVAGLVPGAHEGRGLGNQFLSDLNEADALIHVVDAAGATNERGEPAEPGSFNPAGDIRFLEHELDMWYYQVMMRGWDRFARAVQQEGREVYKAIAKQLSGLRVTEDMVRGAIRSLPENVASWNEGQLKSLASALRKKSKPMVIAANKLDLPVAIANLGSLKKEFPDYWIIGCSADFELALKEAGKKGIVGYVPGERSFEIKGEVTGQRGRGLETVRKFLEEHSTGVQDVLNFAVFDLLRYIAVYPVANSNLTDKEGNVLPDCLLMRPGSTALDLAFALHSDIGKGFVKAIDLKTKRVIGKEHVLKDGDVVEIATTA